MLIGLNNTNRTLHFSAWSAGAEIVSNGDTSTDNLVINCNNSDGQTQFRINNTIEATVHVGLVDIANQLEVGSQARYSGIADLGTAATTESWDVADTEPIAKMLMGANNTTLTLSEPNDNTNGTITITQGGTARTVTWAVTGAGNLKWVGGIAPDLTTTNSIHVISVFSYDGTNYVGSFLSNIS